MSGEEMPAALRKLGEDAKKRVQGRRCAPSPLSPDPSKEDGFFASEYRKEDWEPWAYILLDAFGTRNYNVANAFMTNLRAMCPTFLDGETWKTDPHAFEQAVAIVASLRPESEAEAAQAAGMVAVHLTTMKVAARVGTGSLVDPRTANALSGLVRTYSAGMQAMQSRKARSKPQVIKVHKSVTVNYDNRQVRLSPGGRPACGDQPYGAQCLRAGARDATEPSQCATLPSPDETGDALPETLDQGTEAVPTARMRKGRGRSDGEGQRQLSAWGLHARSDKSAAGSCDASRASEGGNE